ncbi:MAG: SIS domain-containing protein [Desulfovibrionaceae bacterium]|nr:SIS domain-containing protein [Desulfovibrionaceae bacterium]
MSRSFARGYLDALKRTCDRLSLAEFEAVVNALAEAYRAGARIFVMGNGGSASCASHLACDLNKGVSFGRDKRFRVISLNDNVPTMLAYANDCCYEDIFVEQLKNFLTPNDLVMGISGSGNSENVLRAVDFAARAGAATVALTGFDGGRLAKLAATALVVPAQDMQIVEDLHLVVTHMLMRRFMEILASDES